MPQDHYLSARQVHIYCRENHLNTTDIASIALECTIRSGYDNDSRSGLLDDIRELLWNGVKCPYKSLDRLEAILELEDTCQDYLDELLSDIQ